MRALMLLVFSLAAAGGVQNARAEVAVLTGNETACSSAALFKAIVREDARSPEQVEAALAAASARGDCVELRRDERVSVRRRGEDYFDAVQRAGDNRIWYVRRGFLRELTAENDTPKPREKAWPSCGAAQGKYRPVDLSQYAFIITRDNACAQVEIIAPLGIADDGKHGVIDVPGYHGEFSTRPAAHVVVELDALPEQERKTLFDNCPLYSRCMKRWQLTLLRHEDAHKAAVPDTGASETWIMPAEHVRLDGWRR